MKYFVFLILLTYSYTTWAQTSSESTTIDSLNKVLQQAKEIYLKQDSVIKLANTKVTENFNDNVSSQNRINSALGVVLTGLSLIVIILGLIGFIEYRRLMKKIKKIKRKAEKHLTIIKNIENDDSAVLNRLFKKRAERHLCLESIDRYYYEDKNFLKALSLIEKLLSIYPDDDELQFLCSKKKAQILGDVENENKDIDQAIELYKCLQSKKPNDIDILEELGACYYIKFSEEQDIDEETKMKCLAEAKEYFKQMRDSSIDPLDKAKAWVNIGICNLQLNFFEKAYTNFRKILGVFDSQDDENYYKLTLGLLICYNELNKKDLKAFLYEKFEQQQEFDKSLEFCKTNFPDLIYFILILESSYKKYHEDKNRNVPIDPKNRAFAQVNTGTWYLQLKMFEKALANFSEIKGAFDSLEDENCRKLTLGLLICYNELDDMALKPLLHKEFDNQAKFNIDMEFWKKDFTDFKYFIERLQESFKKYNDNK